MPDILSQGGGREHGPWPRRVLLAAAVLALAAVAIVHYLPQAKPATKPAAAAATPPPAVSGAVSGDAAVAAEPNGITGHVLSWPGGLRLPAAGNQPEWFWPATGQVTRIGGLPPQQSGYQFTRVPGGWAVQADPASQTDPATQTTSTTQAAVVPSRAVYFLADAGRSAAVVGQANTVAPGTPGTLWLTSYPPGADPGTTAGTAWEISVAGRPLGLPLTLPAGYLIVQGTGHGLLLAPVTRPGTMGDKLWDPATARSVRTFADVIAASATEIAWAPPCTGRCQVRVLDLSSGRQISAELSKASWVSRAAFSPDGKFLALQVSFGDNSNDGQVAVQLESLAMASGRLTVVPQTWVSSDAMAGFGWPGGGDSLVAELSFTTKVQLASWHPGASRLAIDALRPAQGTAAPAALVIGQDVPSP